MDKETFRRDKIAGFIVPRVNGLDLKWCIVLRQSSISQAFSFL